jgi:hypothetical protein
MWPAVNRAGRQPVFRWLQLPSPVRPGFREGRGYRDRQDGSWPRARARSARFPPGREGDVCLLPIRTECAQRLLRFRGSLTFFYGEDTVYSRYGDLLFYSTGPEDLNFVHSRSRA